MPTRRPRRPKKMARKYKRSAVARNPKNVKFIDRQLIPYKSARGQYVPRAYNVETKIIDLPPQATNLTNNDASALTVLWY